MSTISNVATLPTNHQIGQQRNHTIISKELQIINAMNALEPLLLFYSIDGNMMFDLSSSTSKHCKDQIDQKCKERILISKGDQLPLLYVNWLITPKCNFNCPYCYAKDIMRSTQTPTLDDILATAHTILQFDPVVVVLSGGEPFLSPYLNDIISCLHGKTNIIIDTNGSIINHTLLQTIKEKKILLRISLDDTDPARNTQTRCSSFTPMDQTMQFISQCIYDNIDFVVQTVVTNKNYHHLQEIKEYLQNIGVKYWRLLPVSVYSSEASSFSCSPQEISKLRGILPQRGNMNITVQHNYENERAGIVLVSPDGTFLTVNNDGKKICIDPSNPRSPKKELLHMVIDWKAHYLRYIAVDEEWE